MPAPVAPTPIDEISLPPTIADPVNFDARSDQNLLDIYNMVPQINAVTAVTYTNALSAKESADAAQADKAIVATDKGIVASYKSGAETAKNQAEVAAAAAQAAAGLPVIANKDGGVLTVVDGGVTFARLRGEKQLRSKSFAAKTGKSYAITTLAGAVTMTLPPTPSPFTSIEISDYGQVAHKNKITIAQNGITQIAKTNILLQSKNLFVSPWANAPSAGFTVTQSTDIPAPDGVMGNVTKYVAASPVQQLFTRQAGLTIASAATRMVSMYVFIPSGQVTDYQVQFNYNDVDTATASSTTFDQWVRVSALITTTAARTTLNAKIKVNGGSTPAIGFVMYAGFAQDEADTLTTFITTTTAAVTRGAGVFNYPIMAKNASYVFDVKGGNAILEFINEFVGWQITQLQNRPEANVFDNGTSASFNYQNGQHQKWAPSGTTQTVTLTGWAEDGLRSELFLETTNLGLVTTLTWPTINWFKGDGTFTTSFPTTGIVFNSAGKDFIGFFTMDGGTTIYGKVIR